MFTFAKTTLLLLALAGLTACCAFRKETIPVVRVAPNASGIEIQKSEEHGPRSLMPFECASLKDYPHAPSGVCLTLARQQAFHAADSELGSLEVVSLENPKRYFLLSDSISQWKAILNGGKSAADLKQWLYQKQVSEIPWVNAGRGFHGKLRTHTYPWGKAILFLTAYAQGKTGGALGNDMLVLTVQGLTHDGRYAVRGHFEIRHPKLPDSGDREKRKVYFDFDEESAKAGQWLDRQPDGSFRPTFAQYEAFLQALEIKPPRSR